MDSVLTELYFTLAEGGLVIVSGHDNEDCYTFEIPRPEGEAFFKQVAAKVDKAALKYSTIFDEMQNIANIAARYKFAQQNKAGGRDDN
jgi:hypothetical protein